MSIVTEAKGWSVIEDRVLYLQKLVVGLDVLDVGCTGIRADGRIPDPATGLHKALRSAARSLMGVDIDGQGVERMSKAGFNVVCSDITTMDLGRDFDVIVAGEIVEHLPNPCLSLANLKRHLRPAGKLVLTTPNAFQIHLVSKVLRHGLIRVHEEHTAWYDPQTLSVMLRHAGLRLVTGVWIHSRQRFSLLGLLAKWRRYYNRSFLVVAVAQDEGVCPDPGLR